MDIFHTKFKEKSLKNHALLLRELAQLLIKFSKIIQFFSKKIIKKNRIKNKKIQKNNDIKKGKHPYLACCYSELHSGHWQIIVDFHKLLLGIC